MDYSLLQEETKNIEISGIDTFVQIKILWTIDPEPVKDSFAFGNDQEDQEYLDRFETGELMSIIIIVTASAECLEGLDSLCGVHVRTQSGRFDEDVKEAVRSNGMVTRAIDDLKTQILNSAKRLVKYL